MARNLNKAALAPLERGLPLRPAPQAITGSVQTGPKPKARPKSQPKSKPTTRVARQSGGPRGDGQTAPVADLRTDIEQTFARLSGEFEAALVAIGAQAEGSRALARQIGADVALCQRLLSALRLRGTLSERVAAWPGLAGVRTLASRLAKVGSGRAQRSPLQGALEQYARIIRDAGGSHTRLVRRVGLLEAGGHGGGQGAVQWRPSAAGTARRALVRAADELVGYGAELATFIGAVRPIADTPELMEGCSAWGLRGLRTHGGKVCVTSRCVQMRSNAGSVAQEVRWTPLGEAIDARDGLLPEFSTAPSPLTAHEDGDGYIRQMVDFRSQRAQNAVDLVLARKWSPDVNPQHTPHPVWSQVFRMRHPVKRMLLDVYIHRSMLSTSPPQVGAYYWHPALGEDPRAQWHDRIDGSPAVQILPGAPMRPVSDAWEQQHELTDRLFALSGWNRGDFVGFRCDERYPIWGAAYYMTFEFAPGIEPKRPIRKSAAS